MHTCTQCKFALEDSQFTKDPRFKNGLRRWCKVCTRSRREQRLGIPKALRRAKRTPEEIKEYQKQYRVKRHEEIRGKQKEYKRLAYQNPLTRLKMLARVMANTAVKAGILNRSGQCQKCKRFGITHLHHEDYAKPLDVIEFCRSCHVTAHKARQQNSAIDLSTKTE